MAIRIGFSTTAGLLSWAIRAVTRSSVSHCFLLCEFYGVPVAMEAHEREFRIQSFDVFCAQNKLLALVTPAVDLTPAMPDAAMWLGSGYDFAGLAGNLVVRAGRWMRRVWRNPFRSPDSQFCSEACTRVLQLAHHPGADMLDPEATAPQDLLMFLQSQGCAVEKTNAR